MPQIHYNSIAFLHIPKTAGSTLQQIIRRNYKSNEGMIYEKNRMAAFLGISEKQRKKVKIFMGHFSFGLNVHQYLSQPTTYFTILRNPVDRVISTYFYIIRNPEHTHYKATLDLSLYDFVKNGVSPVGIDNGMTRLLCGVDDASSIPFGGCTKKMLQMAKNNLAQYFSVIGFTDRFDETLILLKKLYGWRPFYTKENVSRNRPAAPPSTKTIDLIKSYNEYDIQLYDYARGIFEERLSTQVPSIEIELKKFKLLNSIYKINRMNPVYLIKKKIRWGLRL